jgi:hypothetical protein
VCGPRHHPCGIYIRPSPSITIEYENDFGKFRHARTGRRLGSPTAGQPVVFATGDGPLLVLRLRDSPVGPTSIYDVDPVTGRSSLIGEVDDALLNLPYELVGRHIVRMREGRLQVMAVG